MSFLIFLHVFAGVLYGGQILGLIVQLVLMCRVSREPGRTLVYDTRLVAWVCAFILISGVSVVGTGGYLVHVLHLQTVQFVLRARELMVCSFCLAVVGSLYPLLRLLVSVCEKKMIVGQSVLFLLSWMLWASTLYHMVAKV